MFFERPAMINIASSSLPKISAEQTHSSAQAPATPKTAVKAGAVIVLTPSALKLSRELQAITSDPATDPVARLEATDKLRQLALKIFNED